VTKNENTEKVYVAAGLTAVGAYNSNQQFKHTSKQTVRSNDVKICWDI